MKRIIVPTDFSPCALNAARFACELSTTFEAEIVLMHAFYLNPEIPFVAAEIEPIAGIHELNLKDLQGRLIGEFPHLQITYILQMGTVVDEICMAGEVENGDLLVMGTHGVSGFFEKIIIGTTAAEVIAASKKPVFVIPEQAKFKDLKRIVFAVDYHELKDNSPLSLLVDLATRFHSEVNFVSVQEKLTAAPDDRVGEEVNFDLIFKDIKHSFRVLHHANIAQTIEAYALKKQADLLVTMPQKHNFLSAFFHRSISRDLAFRSKLPLLCLPEE